MGVKFGKGVENMASELAIYYTLVHFMRGVKSGTTPAMGCLCMYKILLDLARIL